MPLQCGSKVGEMPICRGPLSRVPPGSGAVIDLSKSPLDLRFYEAMSDGATKMSVYERALQP